MAGGDRRPRRQIRVNTRGNLQKLIREVHDRTAAIDGCPAGWKPKGTPFGKPEIDGVPSRI
jgi:hypothetical protein